MQTARPDVPLIDRPHDTDALNGLDVTTAAMARDLAANGFAIFDLGPEAAALCDAASREAEPLFRGFNRLQGAWRRSAAVRTLAAHPEVIRRLSALYGRKAFPFQTLNFRAGSQQGAHIDTAHFHSDPPGFMCGVWWALEDVTLDAGPLFYHPGSHRLPMPRMVNDDEVSVEDRERDMMGELARRLEQHQMRAEPALLSKGQAFVWAANLAHGGLPIQRPGATRRSLVVHYYFDACRYMTPIASSGGKAMTRLPTNVATGGWSWPRDRQGRRAPISASKVAYFLGEHLLRPVYRR